MVSQHKTYFLSCIVAASFFANIATAQNLPIVHTIKQGETLSALAKQYNTTVGDIMRLNGMNSKSQLQIGQGVKIPTNAKTPTIIVEAPKDKPETVKPKPVIVAKQPETSVSVVDVTYQVLKGQSLYGIAKQFKTTEAQIIAWNNLQNDKIKAGQTIIVGKETLEKSTIPVTPKPQIAKPVEDKPVEAPPVAQQPNKNDELTTLNAGSAKVTTADINPTKTPIKEVINTQPALIPASTKYVESEGFFAGYFNHKDKNLTTAAGDAAIFKTTSGWTDKKYYVLMNDVNQGNIVRLTANNKTICAKVLGPLPDIKEDNGLIIRLSNAAAAQLGVEDAKFNVTVNY